MTSRRWVIARVIPALLGACSAIDDGAEPSAPAGRGLSTALDSPSREWSEHLTSRRRLHSATLVRSGPLANHVVVIGGFDEMRKPVGTVEAFDPAREQWTVLGTIAPRALHTATWIEDDGDAYVLVVGGYDENQQAVNEVLRIFDDGTINVEASTIARAEHSATLLPDGRVLIAGGGPEQCMIYNPKQRDNAPWSEGPDLSRDTSGAELDAAVYGHAATLTAAGELLLVGGSRTPFYVQEAEVDQTSSARADAWLCPLSPGPCAAAPALNHPRGARTHAAFQLGDSDSPLGVVVVGGQREPEVRDPATGVWNLLTWAPKSPSWAGFVADGREIVVLGGRLEGTPKARRDGQILLPFDAMWSEPDQMSEDRYFHSLTPLADGEHALVAGGLGSSSANGPRDTSEVIALSSSIAPSPRPTPEPGPKPTPLSFECSAVPGRAGPPRSSLGLLAVAALAWRRRARAERPSWPRPPRVDAGLGAAILAVPLLLSTPLWLSIACSDLGVEPGAPGGRSGSGGSYGSAAGGDGGTARGGGGAAGSLAGGDGGAAGSGGSPDDAGVTIGPELSVGWSQLVQADPRPAARFLSAMTVEHEWTLFLFGGASISGGFGDTWRLDLSDPGSAWASLDAVQPEPRAGHALAFAPNYGVILFGGQGDAVLGDTWLSGGAGGWQRICGDGCPGPSARHGHAMTYDSLNQRIILFGGSDGSTSLGDTWEWAGSWTQLCPRVGKDGTSDDCHSPPPRHYHGLTFDTRSVRTVLYGGRDESGELADAWSFDGTRWYEEAVAPSPEAARVPRAAHAFAYEPRSGLWVLFGGSAGDSVSGRLWALDPRSDRTWVEADFAVGEPVARAFASMAWDEAHGRLLVFGGTGEGDHRDLWGATLHYASPMRECIAFCTLECGAKESVCRARCAGPNGGVCPGDAGAPPDAGD